MYKQTLIQAGLSEKQALIYEILLKNGSLTASKISIKSHIKRGLTYNILDDLLDMGIIEKEEENKKVAIFRSSHPLKLKDLAEKKEEEAKNSQLALSNIMTALISDFNLSSGQPGIQYLEGIEGLKKMYKDILELKPSELLIIPSRHDIKNAEIHNIINKEIIRQQKAGIKSKILAGTTSSLVKERIKYDKEKNIFWRTTESNWQLLSQIIIYNYKIALTSFSEDKIITTLIHNEEISNTFRQIFMFMWKNAKELN